MHCHDPGKHNHCPGETEPIRRKQPHQPAGRSFPYRDGRKTDTGNIPQDDKDKQQSNTMSADDSDTAEDTDNRKTVTINGEQVPLDEGENITKNDYTGLLCVGVFAGVLLIAGAREFVVRKRLK